MLKTLIEEYYHLEVIGSIKVSPKVYKIKCKDGFYYFKETCGSIDTVMNHLQALHLHCFIKIIKTKDNKYTIKDHDRIYYLMKGYEEDDYIVKELKMNEYLHQLVYLHHQSFFSHNVDEQFFNNQIQDLKKMIMSRHEDYEKMMRHVEDQSFRSPAGWMLIVNYKRIDQCLYRSYEFLKRYQEEVKNKKEIKLALTYQNFDDQHIFLKEKKLISIDKIKIDFCIRDLYDLLQKSNEYSQCFQAIKDIYLHDIHLDKELQTLFCVYIYLIPMIIQGHDEIENIFSMARLIRYLDAIEEDMEKILFDG